VSDRTKVAIATRAGAVWLVLICAEILHGILRGIFLVPHVGEFRSSQIGVFTGSVIILAIALVFVRWIGAPRTTALLAVGVLWLVLTLAFEVLFGRFVVGASWERLGADYNVLAAVLAAVAALFISVAADAQQAAPQTTVTASGQAPTDTGSLALPMKIPVLVVKYFPVKGDRIDLAVTQDA